ncbi:protein mab-21-like 3 [Mercenaria mercenaria]|uniref:protein mab-21-like 3 n=1 Tax=Mercenaria mercenaria TaxID=6596 RepID=UPI00234E3F2F|nr:protein mab-21-like 3 [Mercenaria mercenaria]
MGCNRFCRQFILERKSLPRKFLHSNLQTPRPNIDRFHTYRSARQCGMLLFNPTMMGSNESIRQLGCVELIPLDVKKDLFEKLTVALSRIWNQNVNISRACHGPALKMTIKPGRGSPVQHDINVDISVSLHCDIPITAFGWPREETKRAFSMEHINEVLKAGIHLVPKKDLFWAISFSKAERALLSILDADQGCRKYVAKIMKKHVMTCSSQSSNGLPGISSHIIKTQILWSCEKHHNCPDYWHWGNRDICLINTMKELENTLTSKRLLDYFNPAVNILEDKEAAVLTKLAEFMQKRRNELENMK